MAREEAARTDGIEAVSIVTPNHLHAAAAHAFLDADIHVICDKPLTATLADARARRPRPPLGPRLRPHPNLHGLSDGAAGPRHGPRGRARHGPGRAGRICQDWLAEPVEEAGNPQAVWRTDPARAGASGCIGDIGTHAFNLAAFVTGLVAEAVSAELTTFVPGRRLDDDVRAMLRYAGGARGSLWASQVAVGEENEVRLRVYGTAGGLDWCQRDANRLSYTPLGGVRQILTRNGAQASDSNRRASRVPAGHPEGHLESFANLYSDAADAIAAARDGGARADLGFPSFTDGVAGLAFVDAAVRSLLAGGVWTPLP